MHPFLVLEFELRKAQDTIKSLRATLTKSAGLYLKHYDDSSEVCVWHFFNTMYNPMTAHLCHYG